MRLLLISALTCLSLTAGPLVSETISSVHGGDTYAAGEAVNEAFAAPRDIFAAGSVITASGSASGDLHAAGFDLDLTTQTAGSIYAAGSSVSIGGATGQDVTAAGFSVRSTAEAVTQGNLRFFGRTLTIEGPIAGSLTAFGGTVYLNAPVTGDAWIKAEKVTFGPQARIDGQLTLSREEDSAIPTRVIPADRITLVPWDSGRMLDTVHRNWDYREMPMMPVWFSLFAGFVISTIFLLVLAAIFLTFAPRTVDGLRLRITQQPLQSFLLGVVGLSALFGMVPITGLTLIGLPFVPFAMLMILVAWTLGYVLAAYAIARRLLLAFDGPPDPSLAVNILIVALAVGAVGILNFVPFLGWVVNFTLVLLGVGSMTGWLLARFIPDPDPALELDMRTPAED